MTDSELTTYLTSIEGKKNQTVSSSLERIKLLRNLLSEHGKELKLDLSGIHETLNDTTDSTLEKVVEEYNKIILRGVPSATSSDTISDNAIKVSGTQVVSVYPGYYPNGFEVTGTITTEEALESLKDEINKYANENYVVSGGRAIKVVEKEDKTLQIVAIPGTVGTYTDTDTHNLVIAQGSETRDDNKTYLTLTTEEANKKETNDITLRSNIPYYDGQEEVKITIVENEYDGLKYITPTTLSTGYYNNYKIYPVLELTGDNKVVNIEDNITINIVAQGQTIKPSDGYDYIKSGTIIVKPGTSAVVASYEGARIKLETSNEIGWVESTTIEAKESGGVKVTQSSTDTNVYYVQIPVNTSGYFAKDKITQDNKTYLAVTPNAGYYDGTSSVQVYTVSKDSAGNETKTPIQYINTGVYDETSSKYIVPVGIVDTPITIDKSTVNVSNSTITSAGVTVINVQSAEITTTEGYTPGETIPIQIKEATDVKLTYESVDDEGNSKVYVSTTSGWIDDKVDVTNSFAEIADSYAEAKVDRTQSTEDDTTSGQVLFTYYGELNTAAAGILIKNPKTESGYAYFKSAKVDLRDLINNLDNI